MSANDTSVQPGFFRRVINEIKEDFSVNNGAPPINRDDVLTFIFISVMLTVFFYWGRPSFLRGAPSKEVAEMLEWGRKHEYYRMIPYALWAASSLLMRVVAPCLFIWFVLKDKISNYGYRLKSETKHGFVYLAFFVGMLPVLVGVSFVEGFQKKYPFYKGAADSLLEFGIYEVFYGLQFVGLEAFFRGFIIFALFKRFGYYSVLIMTVPYCMIHFGKPPAEAFGSILAGIALGYLALKSKSWFHGALLHWGVGAAMDVLSIIQRGGFKD